MIRAHSDTDIFTVIFLVCLICLAVNKLIYPKRFDLFSNLIINNRYTKVFIKDQHFFDLFENLFFVNLCFNCAIFFFLITNEIIGKPLSELLLLQYSFLIASFLIIKILLELLISKVFEIEWLTKDYLLNKINYRNYLGLILLPINGILIFSFNTKRNTLIVISLLLLIILCMGLLTFLKANLNQFKRSMFYFILYLCALEIAPYLIVYHIIAIK